MRWKHVGRGKVERRSLALAADGDEWLLHAQAALPLRKETFVPIEEVAV